MSVTLIIARHGNTFGPDQTPTRVGARTDLPLVAKGREQGHALGRYLRDRGLVPDEVYCSRLRRTRETATLALEALGVERAVTALDIFDEIDYGVDENQPEDAVIARIGEHALADWDAHAIVPEGWLADPVTIANNWRSFLNKKSEIPPNESKIVLVLTSNGIARFAPALAENYTSFFESHALKLSTGCCGILFFHEKSWEIKDWNIRPK